jgi:hypothetical protein
MIYLNIVYKKCTLIHAICGYNHTQLVFVTTNCIYFKMEYEVPQKFEGCGARLSMMHIGL